MTNRAKEYLSRIRLLEIKIRQRENEYAELLTEISSPKSQDFTADRVQSSPHPDPLADVVIKCEELKADTARLITQYRQERHRIIAEIQTLDNPQYVEILSMRYVSCIPLPMIARILRKSNGKPYSYQRVASIHGDALMAFENNVLKKKYFKREEMRE